MGKVKKAGTGYTTINGEIGDILAVNSIDGRVGNVTTLSNVFTIQTDADNWSSTAPYTQTVLASTCRGLAAPGYDLYLPDSVTVSEAEEMIEAFSYVNKLETANGSVTITCYSDKPISDFYIQIKECI